MGGLRGGDMAGFGGLGSWISVVVVLRDDVFVECRVDEQGILEVVDVFAGSFFL